jgi:hypothetical protein
MKILLFLSLFNLPQLAFSQNERTIIRNLQKGKLQEDTSYVYWLPYKEKTSQLMVQGYLTNYSHKTLIANDFKMKSGTIICASRAGVVFDVMEASNIGGLKDKENHWNYILILHNDSSTAIYGHLQQNGAMVTIGDTIAQGQEIGVSGNTGYSAFPHLHFQVRNKEGIQIPVRFLTKHGKQYLRQLRSYESIHVASEKKK